MGSFFTRFKRDGQAVAAPAPPEVRLELSGPVLSDTLTNLLNACEEDGGIERYVEAVKFKISLFQDAFKDGGNGLSAENFLKLCMFMPTVRRRIGDYVEPDTYPDLLAAMKTLFGSGDINARITSPKTKNTAGPMIWRQKFCTIPTRNCTRLCSAGFGTAKPILGLFAKYGTAMSMM